MATAATLPSSSSSAAAAVQTISRVLSFPRRGGGGFLHLRRHPLAAAAAATRGRGPLLRLGPRRPFSASASAGDNGAAAGGDGGGCDYDYDLFTIGAGSGGMRASRVAASLYGARAAVCEMPFATVASDSLGGVGGTCVLRGCVPKKLLVYASKYSHEFEESHGFGWRYGTEPKHDWSTLMTNKNLELQRLVGVQTNMLKNSGVTIIEGRGKLVVVHSMPDIPGIEHVIDSDASLDLPSRPEKIAIVGGGYIALEFAGIFNGLKSGVHVFIRQKKVLRGFDEEVRDFVADQMSLRGITFHTEETPQAVMKSDDGLLTLTTNKGSINGFSHNLGLEEVGVKMDKHGAIVGELDTGCINGSAVPSAVFSQPPIGQVGLTEEKAIEKYGDVDVYTSNFRPLRATLSGLPDRVYMKVIVCANTNKVLGVHVCGEDAPEIIQGIAIAVKAGLMKQNFDATIGVHPTTAEELVTMRSPTRKVRRDAVDEAKMKDEATSQK
ncbi:Os10g0415112 [Oryza sativa Japonica Group]|uniref:glutathione-disulfide reductase n=1 Tax=Oryza sativa subsp. japonica TaxID=39947 RepID=C7J7Q4_ORYSJ|nr:Os10g0415112 [Oryza sativa Japonica Group]|eukprot:NP_001176151.1 Os10g0415112 [Oryza sativa Japonica Group]